MLRGKGARRVMAQKLEPTVVLSHHPRREAAVGGSLEVLRTQRHEGLPVQHDSDAPRLDVGRLDGDLNRLVANRFADKTSFTPSVLGYPFLHGNLG